MSKRFTKKAISLILSMFILSISTAIPAAENQKRINIDELNTDRFIIKYKDVSSDQKASEALNTILKKTRKLKNSTMEVLTTTALTHIL